MESSRAASDGFKRGGAVSEEREAELQHTSELLKVCHTPDIHPEDWARFIELPGFTKAWKRLGFTDADRTVLELSIMVSSNVPTIKGTGGLKKIRFAGEHSSKGKSSGSRVCYAYYSSYSVVLLVLVYPKSRKDDLTQKEKNTIKGLLNEFEQALDKGDIDV